MEDKRNKYAGWAPFYWCIHNGSAESIAREGKPEGYATPEDAYDAGYPSLKEFAQKRPDKFWKLEIYASFPADGEYISWGLDADYTPGEGRIVKWTDNDYEEVEQIKGLNESRIYDIIAEEVIKALKK